MEATRDTCLKLLLPDSEPVFVKGTWYQSHFELSITDGLDAWSSNGSEKKCEDTASRWDQPVSEVIQLCESYLKFQHPEAVYGFKDAGNGCKRLSWTFVREGIDMEYEWECQPSFISKKTTAGVLDFLMDAHIHLNALPPPPVPGRDPEPVIKNTTTLCPIARRFLASIVNKVQLLSNRFKEDVINDDGHFFHNNEVIREESDVEVLGANGHNEAIATDGAADVALPHPPPVPANVVKNVIKEDSDMEVLGANCHSGAIATDGVADMALPPPFPPHVPGDVVKEVIMGTSNAEVLGANGHNEAITTDGAADVALPPSPVPVDVAKDVIKEEFDVEGFGADCHSGAIATNGAADVALPPPFPPPPPLPGDVVKEVTMVESDAEVLGANGHNGAIAIDGAADVALPPPVPGDVAKEVIMVESDTDVLGANNHNGAIATDGAADVALPPPPPGDVAKAARNSAFPEIAEVKGEHVNRHIEKACRRGKIVVMEITEDSGLSRATHELVEYTAQLVTAEVFSLKKDDIHKLDCRFWRQIKGIGVMVIRNRRMLTWIHAEVALSKNYNLAQVINNIASV